MARIWVGAPRPGATGLADRTPPDTAVAALARWVRRLRPVKGVDPAKT